MYTDQPVDYSASSFSVTSLRHLLFGLRDDDSFFWEENTGVEVQHNKLKAIGVIPNDSSDPRQPWPITASTTMYQDATFTTRRTWSISATPPQGRSFFHSSPPWVGALQQPLLIRALMTIQRRRLTLHHVQSVSTRHTHP